MMNAPIVLITAFCLFLSYFPQSAHSSAKTVCFGKGNESFTVEAWHNGQMKYNYDTHLDNATGQQCAVVNTQNWVGLSDYEVITFSRYPNNELLGIVTVRELRQTDNNALCLMKKKKIFFQNKEIRMGEAKTYHIFVFNRQRLLFSKRTKYDSQEKKNYVEIHSTQWDQFNGDDLISFKIGGENVVGTATVQLLCEIAEHAEVIDFSQGVRHYYRDANGALFFSDANDVVYFVGANDDLYSVHGNGDWQLLPKP